MRSAPRFTHADRLAALGDSLRRYAARGVTAIYEGHGIAPEVLAVYREAHARGALKLRAALAVSPTWDAADAERAIPEVAAWAGGRGLGDDRLRVAGISLHYGGDPEVARILHAAQPYTGWAGFVESANSPDAYREQAELAARHRLRVNTLVTRNLPEVLDVWEKIAQSTPIADLRWVAVHLNAATGDQLARLKRLGATRHASSAMLPRRCCLIAVSSACVCLSGSPPTTSRPIPGWRSGPSSSAPTWPRVRSWGLASG